MSDPIHIHNIDDPRLSVYRRLKERELAKLEGRFIAESEHVVKRLLASSYRTDSVLVAQRQLNEIAPLVPADVPLYVVSDSAIHDVVGYRFHTGMIACGFRGNGASLDEITANKETATIVVCPDLISHENLGSIVRTAAGFGADGVLLGPQCCDPFYRLAIRVSMGTVFSMPICRSNDLIADLKRLREEMSYDVVATVLDQSAEELLTAPKSKKLAILFGNEAQGLSREVISVCNRKVTLSMKRGTDSLNVSIAAGIFLYHFSRE